MKDFRGKTAVITGGGTGMGRALARQLAQQGCHVAMCDVLADNLEESRTGALTDAAPDTRVTTHLCDVSDEGQMEAFRDAAVQAHGIQSIELLFNNAGISGGGSFVNDSRAEWEKTFGVCWSGVYYGTRVFLPLLIASAEGCIINTSSVNGFWASLGPATPHTAYSAAKFAVKGFTEALMTDLRIHAPHVKAALVMPGHIGTSIPTNSARVLGRPTPRDMEAGDLEALRDRLSRQGIPTEGVDDAKLRTLLEQRLAQFETDAPVTADAAAAVILEGVREERWRILIGDDAVRLDRMVRETPEDAYGKEFAARVWAAQRSGSG